MDDKVKLLMFSLLLIIIMLFSNKLYNNSNLIKSRGYFFLSIIILLVILISVSLISKLSRLEIFGFGTNGISQSDYNQYPYNETTLKDVLNTKSFVLILIFLFFYIFIKLPFIMYYGKNNIKDLENIEIVIYVLLAFFTPLLWLLRMNKQPLVNKTNILYVLLLLVITLCMVVVLFRNETKDFFDNSTYGYICPRNNFKDVLIEGSLICPKKNE